MDRGGDNQSDIRISASASSVPPSTANRRQLPEIAVYRSPQGREVVHVT